MRRTALASRSVNQIGWLHKLFLDQKRTNNPSKAVVKKNQHVSI
jgi:hypothetical protein